MDDWYEAGRLTAKVRDYGKKLIKENIKLIDVTENIEKFTLDNNINLAFPIQLSINEIAAHYAAFVNDDIIFKKNDKIIFDLQPRESLMDRIMDIYKKDRSKHIKEITHQGEELSLYGIVGNAQLLF